LFSQRVFNKLSELIGKSPIPFEQITFGELLSFIKKEGISLCNELKLQARYSTDNTAKRKELGSFCEAFCLSKLEVPSLKKRRKTQTNKKKPYTTRISNYKKVSPKKTTPKKKMDNTNTCYKCGKLGHYAKDCKVKKKLNEICAEHPDIQEKLIALFELKDTPNQSENSSSSSDYEDSTINELESDSSEYSSGNKSSRLCYKCINVITTNNSEKEFLLDLIEQIQDTALRKDYLQKLKGILIKEDSLEPPHKVSINKIFETREIPNILKAVNIQDLKNEINILKEQIKILHKNLCSLQTKDLELETWLTLIENRPSSSNIQTEDTPTNQHFVSTINRINFHKWYIPITLKIKDSFEFNTIALLDSGADQNCIQEGLIPSTYYERTKERLHTTNGTALQVKYKLSNAYICDQEYCFKNSFILVRDMSQEVILGTPFITQIYPFKVDQTGVHTEIMDTIISFKFVTSIPQNNLSLLQNASITKQINVIECNNPRYWYKLERLDVIKRLNTDQKELQEINQQLEELNISLRNHIASIDFKEFYTQWLHDYHQFVC